MWLMKWFTSIFILSFPVSLCIRIWDNLLANGTIYLFQVSLAILKLLEPDLLKLDLDGICKYFSSFKEGEFASYQGG
jgi:F0F1-type ATP synthase membrane subunit a